MQTSSINFQGKKRIKVALAGNPNTGKTTIFNSLTGGREHVGNYPGVTVEKVQAVMSHAEMDITLVDLPGTYSITAYSLDELIARTFLIDEKPDLIVNVIDASNLQRNLYLSVQLMELRIPMVLVFNRSDIAEARGYTIDTNILSALFKAPIVKTVAHKNIGINELRDAIVNYCSVDNPVPPARIRYKREIEVELAHVEDLISKDALLTGGLEPRWFAVKLIESDSEIKERIRKNASNPEQIFAAADAAIQRISQHFSDSPKIVIADNRYGFISGACHEAIQNSVEIRHNTADRIDAIVTDRLFGIPIFLGLMYVVFKLAFTVGEIPMNWIEKGIEQLGILLSNAWPGNWSLDILSLLVDGVFAGVGGVLVFLPMIILLFLSIAALEDSGYMARAAFIVDRFMHKIGLHGRSFVPMLIGFGCTVPAILATRALPSRRARMTTILVLPLFSCGARLPIYSLFISAFFPATWRTPMLMFIYLIGIALAALLARILTATVFKGEPDAFVMELPPYRIPTFRGLWSDTWERAWLFVRKAGTIILAISVALWFLTTYPKLHETDVSGLSNKEIAAARLSHSIAGRIGHALDPVMRHAGFDWKASTALIGAFAAKEVFV
ncbi:MAG: ferrous iron transport protein B, partial [Lentisphaerae bacterium]|nr:ferrous iron transport protein B [Lentisphaerota bacterium]